MVSFGVHHSTDGSTSRRPRFYTRSAEHTNVSKARLKFGLKFFTLKKSSENNLKLSNVPKVVKNGLKQAVNVVIGVSNRVTLQKRKC